MRKRAKRKLANSPLSLVLCQVRFSPLMAMADYIPQVQDRLRLNGYPVNVSTPIREFQLGPGAPAARDRFHWEFMTKDRRSSVVISESFVVLQTTAYDDFETFMTQLNAIVSTVNEVVGGLLMQRIGLRYVDAIVPRVGESWRDYVSPCLHGFQSPLFTEEEALRLHQTVAPTSIGTMIVRLHQNREGNVLPPDIGPGALAGPGLVGVPGATTTLLDIDHFHACDDEYDQRRFEEIAWALKEASYEVFADHVVSEHALQVWS